MPSLTEIYSSLIENPDIQPPEGQDREAYVVDLAKQRLRQYKNNEKALSLGMQKTAIESLSDYVLTPLRKSMPTTSVGIFADFLQLAINWDEIMDGNGNTQNIGTWYTLAPALWLADFIVQIGDMSREDYTLPNKTKVRS